MSKERDKLNGILTFYNKRPIRKHYLIDAKTPFPIVEAFKNVRTNLSFALQKKSEPKRANIIAVTSPNPMEGKTTIVANLGCTMAATAKILIIDCDLRKPRINRYFKLSKEVGLSTYLSGQTEMKKILFATDYPNLYIIPSGPIPPNPSELFSGDTMQTLVDEMSKNYDYILFDTPPVESVSDCLTLIPYLDGVILVVRNKISSHTDFESALKKLEFAKAKILGVIINAQNEEDHLNSYKYKHNYYRSTKEDEDDEQISPQKGE